jgi:hypothetical protein
MGFVQMADELTDNASRGTSSLGIVAVPVTGAAEDGVWSRYRSPLDDLADEAAAIYARSADADVSCLAVIVEALCKQMALDQLKGTEEWFRRVQNANATKATDA